MKEFKIINVERSEFKKLMGSDFSSVEKMLSEYTAEEWEVVSVSSDFSSGSLTGGLLVTLQRDM